METINNLNDNVTIINEYVDLLNNNLDKFMEKNNISAGKRARKITLMLEKQFKTFRRLSVEVKKQH